MEVAKCEAVRWCIFIRTRYSSRRSGWKEFAGTGVRITAPFRAEAEAVRNGCTHATLDTLDFQAEDFYRKRGYERIGVIENYVLGHSCNLHEKNALT